eukprot:scaffold115_cov241-Pinguiococcus_pyrenoidosus.AAC.15
MSSIRSSLTGSRRHWLCKFKKRSLLGDGRRSPGRFSRLWHASSAQLQDLLKVARELELRCFHCTHERRRLEKRGKMLTNAIDCATEAREKAADQRDSWRRGSKCSRSCGGEAADDGRFGQHSWLGSGEKRGMTEREVNQSELTTRNLEAVSDALSAEAAAAQGGNQSPRGRKAYYRVPSYESSDTGDHTRRVSLDSGFDSSVTAHARKLEHNERVLSVQPEGLKGLDRKTLRSEQSIDTFVNLKGCLQWLNHSQELKEGRLEDDDDEDAVDSPLCVVHPEGRFRAGWDVMISIFMMYLSWIVPFRVGVLTAEEDQRFQDDHRSLSGFDILVDFIFLLDIIIQFRTAYFDRSEQRWQWATKEMALHYAKRTFVLDVIATVPFVARGLIGVEDVSLGQRFGGRLFRLLKLFHIPRVMKASKRLGYLYHLWVHYIGKTEGLGRLLWWLSVMLLLTHWIACGFVLIGDPNGNDPTCVEFDVPPDRCSWLEINQVYLRGIDYRYFIAVHWAVQTLTTVGYGNVSINTITEFIYQSIMMVVGVSWYAYVVSAAATAIRSFDIRNDLIRERMRAVNDFIADSGFPSALATSVRNHFKHIYALEAEETTRRADYDRVEIIQELPQYLLRRVMASLAAPTLKALPQLEILSDRCAPLQISVACDQLADL